MGAHKYAARPTLPLAHRFGFGESQHSQLWSRRLGFNQRSPADRAGALNAWLRRHNNLLYCRRRKNARKKLSSRQVDSGETGASTIFPIFLEHRSRFSVRSWASSAAVVRPIRNTNPPALGHGHVRSNRKHAALQQSGPSCRSRPHYCVSLAGKTFG
jgi:hypothetical protein